MKKTLIILIVFLTASALNAQTLKGSLFAGGYANYYHNNQYYSESEYTGYDLNLNPRIGYFFTDNFATGIFGKFNLRKSGYNNETADYSSTSSSPGAGVFAAYYKDLSNNLYLFYEGGIGYNFNRTEFINVEQSTGNTVKLHLKPGLAYFITPHWAFDVGVELLRYEVTYDKLTETGSKRTSTNLMIYAGLSDITFGVNYHF